MVNIVIIHIWKKCISGDGLRLVICCLEMQQICPDHFEYCTFYYTSAIYRTYIISIKLTITIAIFKLANLILNQIYSLFSNIMYILFEITIFLLSNTKITFDVLECWVEASAGK